MLVEVGWLPRSVCRRWGSRLRPVLSSCATGSSNGYAVEGFASDANAHSHLAILADRWWCPAASGKHRRIHFLTLGRSDRKRMRKRDNSFLTALSALSLPCIFYSFFRVCKLNDDDDDDDNSTQKINITLSFSHFTCLYVFLYFYYLRCYSKSTWISSNK